MLRPLKGMRTAVAAGAAASFCGFQASKKARQESLSAPEPSKPALQPTPSESFVPIDKELDYVTVTMRHDAEHALPRLRLEAHKVPMTDESLLLGLAILEEVLQRKQPFTILWDVRSCCLPSRQQRWAFAMSLVVTGLWEMNNRLVVNMELAT